jgi:hypothetical protein
VSFDTGWFKSSFSMAKSDNCVEVRHVTLSVGVRDSKNPAGNAFWVGRRAWAYFLTQLADG